MIDQVTVDGKREKMSSRKGVVLLEELLDIAEQRAREVVADKTAANAENIKKIALGALKFNDFSRARQTGILFDWDSIFSLQGKSVPYIQYAAVRISSIMTKAAEGGQDDGDNQGIYDWTPERALLLKLAGYPLIVKEAAETYQAHEVATYLYELAKLLNQYYENTPVLKAPPLSRKARLELLANAYNVFEDGLGI